MKNILIGGAWPYANGSLHIGHIAGLLSGDILARYYRAKGEQVFYVSGSDCHGTPVTIRAKQEGETPREISDFYHKEFVSVFNALGFSYDLYTKTSDEHHKNFVKQFHYELYEGDYIYEKTVKQAYCPNCKKSLTDRLIIGKCPVCGEKTRGDQCDVCREIIEIDTILSPVCADCDSELTLTDTTQLFIAISKLEKELRSFLNAHPHLRKNAIAFTKRYIDEGLRDRAITRDLDWGIDVPKEGYGDKKIYIWVENVLGYLSASKAVCDERDIPFEEVWGESARHYYVHGKDNIPFHTIILPSLLLGHGGCLRLPDDIISSEYVTLEGRKISTSQNWAIWAKDIVDRYNPDTLRYFFITNGPEKRDTDFSWHEFVERNNNELLGAYGNFINRTLVFISKYLCNIVSNGFIENEITEQIQVLFPSVGQKIENGQFKDAIERIFEFVRFGNKYFDTNEPWKTRNDNPEKCNQTLFNCVQIIANLSVLLEPFLPFSSAKIFEWLNLNNEWKAQWILARYALREISILFERLDNKIIYEETNTLTEQQK
ncbi:MAG: methionine--tRNA ligase [Clostridiales bacterium GWF2_38_85]|nr:MAG: methionine--tRNA ligase [Clostridiales bacterium GWF2_38_85]HBL84563.1 methionine--tRNA ligase [Clostridiales bacterium]